MAKPLVASSFFTFPKFLLWSLPLFFLLLGTWLQGGLDRSHFSAFLTHVESIIKPEIQHVSLSSSKVMADQLSAG